MALDPPIEYNSLLSCSVEGKMDRFDAMPRSDMVPKPWEQLRKRRIDKSARDRGYEYRPDAEAMQAIIETVIEQLGLLGAEISDRIVKKFERAMTAVCNGRKPRPIRIAMRTLQRSSENLKASEEAVREMVAVATQEIIRSWPELAMQKILLAVIVAFLIVALSSEAGLAAEWNQRMPEAGLPVQMEYAGHKELEQALKITHVVQPGESLSTIATRYGVTVEELVAWNNIINPNLVYVGTVLEIRNASDVPNRPSEVITLPTAAPTRRPGEPTPTPVPPRVTILPTSSTGATSTATAAATPPAAARAASAMAVCDVLPEVLEPYSIVGFEYIDITVWPFRPRIAAIGKPGWVQIIHIDDRPWNCNTGKADNREIGTPTQREIDLLYRQKPSPIILIVTQGEDGVIVTFANGTSEPFPRGTSITH